MILTTPSPHTEAADFLRSKPAVTRAIFDQLLPEFQQRAFTVTGVECAATLARVRDAAASLPEGTDWDDAKDAILGEISPWLIDPNASPEEQQKQTSAANRRAELILKNQGWAAYAVSNHQAMQAMADVFPYAMYVSSEDRSVRATHAALNRKIFPTTHPFWENHTPPWEFGCRCDKVPMLASEVDELRAGEQDLPLEQRRVIEGPLLAEVERGNLRAPEGGTLDIRSPREKQGPRGFEFRPGDAGLTWEQATQNHDPMVVSLFRSFADTVTLVDGRSLSTALGAPGAVAAATPPALGLAPAGAAAAAVIPLTDAEAAQLLLRLAGLLPVSDIAGLRALWETAAGRRQILEALTTI
jgi:SPP1 gp7 family putative phage head morphogenesis protein